MALLQHLPKNFVSANVMLDLHVPTKSRKTEFCINMLRVANIMFTGGRGMITRKFDLLN